MTSLAINVAINAIPLDSYINFAVNAYLLGATLSLNDLPAEKPGTRVAEIVIASPVLGLRPSRA